MLAMTIRRINNYAADAEKLMVRRDLRLLDCLRVAGQADSNGFEDYRSSLERRIDPDAGVTIISMDDIPKRGAT